MGDSKSPFVRTLADRKSENFLQNFLRGKIFSHGSGKPSRFSYSRILNGIKSWDLLYLLPSACVLSEFSFLFSPLVATNPQLFRSAGTYFLDLDKVYLNIFFPVMVSFRWYVQFMEAERDVMMRSFSRWTDYKGDFWELSSRQQRRKVFLVGFIEFPWKTIALPKEQERFWGNLPNNNAKREHFSNGLLFIWCERGRRRNNGYGWGSFGSKEKRRLKNLNEGTSFSPWV